MNANPVFGMAVFDLETWGQVILHEQRRLCESKKQHGELKGQYDIWSVDGYLPVDSK